jgi:amphi-Trp domain-containing protein
MADVREFAFDGAVTGDELADMMGRLAAGIRAGGLSISMGDEELTVFPRGDLELEVAARTKKDKHRLAIAIGWRQARDDRAEAARPDEPRDAVAGSATGTPAGEVAGLGTAREHEGEGLAFEETTRWERTRDSSSRARPRRRRRPRS